MKDVYIIAQSHEHKSALGMLLDGWVSDYETYEEAFNDAKVLLETNPTEEVEIYKLTLCAKTENYPKIVSV